MHKSKDTYTNILNNFSEHLYYINNETLNNISIVIESNEYNVIKLNKIDINSFNYIDSQSKIDIQFYLEQEVKDWILPSRFENFYDENETNEISYQ